MTEPGRDAGTADGPDPAGPDALGRARREATALGLVGVYGFSFGAVAVSSGFGVWQAVLLSAVGFTGGSQFAYVGVLSSGGSTAAAATSALLLGARNFLYAVRLADLLPRGPLRALAAHLVIDETTAMALRHEQGGPRAARTAFWVTGAVLFATWNATTLLGAVGVGLLGDPQRYGLDAAAPAAFLALVWPWLRRLLPALVALVAAALVLALGFVAAPGVPVLASAVVAFVGLHPRAAQRGAAP